KIINSKDHGIPQNRRRLFVIGTRDKKQKIDFPDDEILTTTMFDFLEDNVDKNYYFKQKGFEFITNPKYKSRAQINENIIMCQKAQQQFNWNGSFLFNPMNKKPDGFEEIYLGEYQNKKGIARKLTPRECLRLMGFSDNFKIVVPDKEMYHQAGNSIVVNIFEKIIKKMEIH
ncbi:MAG: DNA (cytosine-5-)-methyltransferase, partial [Metamycoplasmataceae bacterium]